MSTPARVPSAESPFVVLVVCTGNICRSPAAELLLRAGLGAEADVVVSSAGIDALQGDPVAEPMARLLRARGVDADGFTARQLEPTVVRGADLVLTMTTAQRRAVVTAVPSAVRRTFTLVEFAELAELSQVDRLPGGAAQRAAAVLQAAPHARALRAGAADQDDVEDPYRRSDEVFSRVFGAIDDLVRRLVGVLVGPDAPGGAVTRNGGQLEMIGAARRRHGGDVR